MAFNQRGWTQYKLGKLDEAIHDFDLAIRNAPKLSIVYNNRAICYTDQAKYKLAIKDLDRCISLNPISAVAYTNRGTAHMATKSYDKASKDFLKAVKLSPKLADAANGLGWFLATCPDEKFRNGKDAVENANRACELSKWKEWSYIDTLASAHAEVGEFGKAIEMANRALKLAPESETTECKERLALFESKKPFRSEVGKAANTKG